MKLEIVSVIARIGSRQSDANGNKEEDDNDGENGAEADSETIAKKRKQQL
jgi:hypothetical protein